MRQPSRLRLLVYLRHNYTQSVKPGWQFLEIPSYRRWNALKKKKFKCMEITTVVLYKAEIAK